MKKVVLNYWLDILAFIEFAFLSSTGVLIQYSLPERSGRWSSVWGMTRHQWGELHYYLALALFSTMALHLLLHWRWVVNMTQGRSGTASGRRLLLGAFGLLLVLLLASAPAVAPVESMEPTRGAGMGHGGNR